jgi:hypothetical protein
VYLVERKLYVSSVNVPAPVRHTRDEPSAALKSASNTTTAECAAVVVMASVGAADAPLPIAVFPMPIDDENRSTVKPHSLVPPARAIEKVNVSAVVAVAVQA